MAVTATFSAGTLTVFGDNLANTVDVGRNAAGQLLVNGGAVPVAGGTPTVANTALIQVFGQGDNDTITLNESSGALPRANLFGGTGNDAITSGSGNDQLFGQTGNDTLLGKGGNDFLFGGTENDVLTGGDGDDQMFGEAGDDRMIWNPGDDSDLMEGGDGIDTAEVNGGNGAEQFTVTANGTRVRFDRLDPAPFALDIGTTENLVVHMNGGDDTFSATGNLAALIQVTVDGGTGNDTILGGNGNDLLLGGDGNDFLDGQQGNDTVLLGAGNDVFQWDPGDGNDVIEGQAGLDTLRFNGSAASETIAISANGGRTSFTRNVANITLDLNDVETLRIEALAGSDVVTVGDLTGTDVTSVTVNLSGVLGGATGDGSADTVIVTGRATADAINVVASASGVGVTGLPASVTVTASEGANDALVINSGAGNDRINASTMPGGLVRLSLDGGGGNDSLFGSAGDDALLGGDGNDLTEGNQGNDVAFLGTGNDIFRWDAGDGSDVVEGQDGVDTLRFTGSADGEIVNIFANGGRALLLRDVAGVTMDLNDMETVNLFTQGGADTVVIGDLTGTDVSLVALNLGAADGQSDTVIVTGSNVGNDLIDVNRVSGRVEIDGLAADVRLTGFEQTLDMLSVSGLAGDDTIDASGLGVPIRLSLSGGLGNDTLIGSAGGDQFNGGDGNDLALMGAGNDVFTWNPGDDNDVIEGQAGFDELAFNGANVSEIIGIAASGGRTLFSRNVANVQLDTNDVEKISFNAFGGADWVVVNDLTGTDVTEVAINLGGEDFQADTVVVQATGGSDSILVVSENGVIRVLGLAAEVKISGFGAGDTLVINGLGGDDVVDASGLAALLTLSVSGGDGDDVLTGSEGADILLGDAGDDVLIGGPGIDVLDGGTGANILLQ